MLTSPNGQPLGQKNVSVSEEQILAVGSMLIEAQATKLLSLGVSPLIVIDIYLDVITGILARCDSTADRGALVKQVVAKLEKSVTHKAGQLLLNKVTPTSPHRMV